MKVKPQQPLVSIIICSYNHAVFLPDAINSILYQDYPNIEIIVVDDGSTDNTADVVKQFTSVKYFYKQNAGLAAGRNTGILKSTGQYVLFLDADDWLLPSAIKINVNILNENEQAAFVSGGHISVNLNGDVTSIQTTVVEKNHFEELLKFNYIGMHATVLYRRWALDYYMFDTSLTGCDDYDSYLGVAAHFPVLHHTQLLAAYRRHDNNMSVNAVYMIDTVLSILKKHEEKLTDVNLKLAVEKGIYSWKNYYAGKQWKVLINSSFFEITKKINALKFIKKYKPSLIKSYAYGNYRRRQIKLMLRSVKPKSKKVFLNHQREIEEKLKRPVVYTLMYHRITSEACDPWNLCVSPENFESHLIWLKENNMVINLNEFETFLNGKQLPSAKVLLTFDDGYADNFTVAKPLLEKYQIPAIFFLTAKSVLQESSFYSWDILQKIFLEQENIPELFSIKLNNGFIKVSINKKEIAKPTKETLAWSANHQMPVNSRTNAFYKMWVMQRNFNGQQTHDFLEQLIMQSGKTIHELGLPKIANKQMLQQIKAHPLIKVGAHSVTHSILPILSKEEQLEEIVESKKLLESSMQNNITIFSYPDGRFNNTTINCIQDAGFKLAFTTLSQLTTKHSEPLTLSRFKIDDWVIENLRGKIKNWD